MLACSIMLYKSSGAFKRAFKLDFVEYRFSDRETKEKSSGCRVEVCLTSFKHRSLYTIRLVESCIVGTIQGVQTHSTL